MKKGILFIVTTVGLFSCKQGSKSDQNTIDATKLSSPTNVQTQKPYATLIDTKYAYVNSGGESVQIQNSLPKGEGYTDPNGKEYFKAIFWTRITNETSNSLELKLDFPVHSYELPSSPGKHFKILLLPDTMASDQVNLPNYGLTGLQSYLDNRINKPFSLNRKINSKETSGFYFVILFDKGLVGPFRTGLRIKGQHLYYRISKYDSKPAHSLLHEKEIICGSINLKDLIQQK